MQRTVAPLLANAHRIGIASLAFAFVLSVVTLRPAFAQTTLLVPTPIAPTVPIGAAGRSLSQAYSTILAARAANPGAAQAANFQYVIARQRLAVGDVSGALAAAAIAQSLATTPAAAPLGARENLTAPSFASQALGLPGVGTLRAAPPGPTGSVPATAPVPLAGGALSMRLLVARNEIDLAERLTQRDLSAAKARYRTALDRYQSGDAAGANLAADDAYRLAARQLEAGAR